MDTYKRFDCRQMLKNNLSVFLWIKFLELIIDMISLFEIML